MEWARIEEGVNIRTNLARHFALVITLPCHHDGAFLSKTVDILEKVTPAIENDFAVVVAEDGSDSSKIVRDLMLKYNNIVYFHNDRRLGRGKALREAWKCLEADIYMFMDVDMSTDLFQMNAFSNLIRNVRQGSFSLVTGSRYHPNSVVYRPIVRWVASVAYNKIIRLLFGSELTDHQCGFKAFSSDLIDRLSEIVQSDSWFWDTEMIIIAQKKGFKVSEIPIFWIEMKGPRTPVKRLLKDVWLHGTGILHLWWRVYFTGL